MRWFDKRGNGTDRGTGNGVRNLHFYFFPDFFSQQPNKQMALPVFCRVCGYSLPLPNPGCCFCREVRVRRMPDPGFRQYWLLEASPFYPFVKTRLLCAPVIPRAVWPMPVEKKKPVEEEKPVPVSVPLPNKKKRKKPEPPKRRGRRPTECLRPPLQRKPDGSIWCTPCVAWFPTLHAAERHVRGPCHENRYVCPFPGCAKPCSDNTNLLIHLDTHLPVEERLNHLQHCESCGKGFPNVSNKLRHQRDSCSVRKALSFSFEPPSK